jgi:hypothetical protein
VAAMRRVERPAEKPDGLSFADNGKTRAHRGLLVIALCLHLG